MKLGMVGLGRMGGNMAERLRRAGHEVVGYDRDPKASDVPDLAALIDQAGAGDYVAIQAYVDPESGVVDALEDARTAIRDRCRVATTVGIGPRFLHSTGQLHKGGPDTGVFLQLTAEPSKDLPIPGWDESFGTLIAAQALGDLAALQKRGRRALRLNFRDVRPGLDRLEAIRTRIRDATGAATTLGFGPRFLHSTGQLHKGGPNTGLFLQLVDTPEEALPVPETDYTFRQLIRAQAIGDYQALVERDRRVLRVQLGADAQDGLEKLFNVL